MGRGPALETITLSGIPDEAVPAYEAALESVCRSVAFTLDEATGHWTLEAVRGRGVKEAELQAALALAAAVTGHAAEAARSPVEAEGWLARTAQAFPEQRIGRRLLLRPTHVPDGPSGGRIVLRLDAGLAFGSGEHNSTRGCLLAFERLAPRPARHDRRRSARMLDLGAGSGVLGLYAAAWLKRPVLLTDIEPWSVRVAAQNAAMNGLKRLVCARVADGWRARWLKGRRFDLVFANILARPLCAMARSLAAHLAPGGVAVLAGLLGTQAAMVIAAHRRAGLRLLSRQDHGAWTTLVLRR
ncbi:MAG: 50S ribosomal protein L11 methyltransferase [Acetobacteraceae bacterium]|nr:50S ribosomal protein L11 methyltransferase [Acetobacteraceae bacterium]MDW8397887.1 50S ribosomal protein L11 methyltransferase [Acetobacteraceae bacterium]